MPFNREVVLCRYHYDPLDRLVGTTPLREAKLLRFYCKSRLVTEIQGVVQRSIFQQDGQLLAQQNRKSDSVEASLLATDQMRSVLQVVKANQLSPIAYSPYGHRSTGNGLLSLLGFNGEQPDPITGHYMLGNGYRAFSPMLMRFNRPDNLSPFGKGGLNSYAYCVGDPINRYDETGHTAWLQSLSAGLSRISQRITKLFSYATEETTNLSGLVGAEEIAPAEVLKNIKPEDLAYEKSVHKFLIDIGKVTKNDYGVRSVTNIDELRSATNWEYAPEHPLKIILTDRGEIVVGKIFHSVLSDTTTSKNVIAAGHIERRGSNEWLISNTSGHYRPPYSSLVHMQRALESTGAKVKSVRKY